MSTPEPTAVDTTLSQLKSYVTDAEHNGGGWVILNFHGICDNRCTAENSLRRSTFTAFLDWLQPRSANGTVVRTVGRVMGVPAAPRPEPPAVSSGCSKAAMAWRVPGRL